MKNIICAFFFCLICTSLTTACLPQNSSPLEILHPPTETPVAVSEQTTVVVEPGSPAAATEQPVLTRSEPLRFTFPTPQPPPISLWRPALYDVPWALGPFDHFYFTRPIAADDVNWPLADYRYGGMLPGNTFIHTGVDIDAKLHTRIIAAGPGTVTSAGYGLYSGASDPDDPYGLAVTIRHDFGYKGRALYTIYAHMDRIDVSIGQHVEAGEPLGIVGLTGNTSGPHIHFEVRIEDNTFFSTRNPELWLAPPQGWGVLVGRLFNTNNSYLTAHEVQVSNKSSRQKWTVLSYHNTTINSDEYYKENLVLSDLPAGDYIVSLTYQDKPYKAEITIRPGAISFFTFRGKKGFDLNLPPVLDGTDWQFFRSLSQE